MSGLLINQYRFMQTNTNNMLLHLDNSLVDVYGNHTIETKSTAGTPIFSSSVKKFGTHSITIDTNMAGQLYYRTEASYAFDLSGNKPFTLECFAYITGTWVGVPALLSNKFGLNNVGSELGESYGQFRLEGNRLLVANTTLDGWDSVTSFDAYTSSLWQHYVITGSGSTIKVYRDGIQMASVNYPTWTTGNSGGTIGRRFLNLGIFPSGGGIVGQMDEVRFSDSVIYTGAFTPPTSPFT